MVGRQAQIAWGHHLCQTAQALSPPVSASASAQAVPPSPARLSLRAISDYCLPTIGCGFMFLLVTLYLMKFATDVLGIAPAAMGVIFGVSRFWDAISDPLVGYWSDKTRTTFGRRRPWILLSALPISLVYLMVWSPPLELSNSALVLWMGVGVIGFYSAMTGFVVPHLSLGAELSVDYYDRNRIFGIRHVTWTLGSVLALGGMAVLIDAETQSVEAARAATSDLALVVAVITAAMLVFTATRVKERSDFQERGPEGPFAAFADVWKNPHARLLLVVTLVENLGAATIGVLALYVADYIIGEPELAPLFILAYMATSIASVPLWIPVSRAIGKKRLWTFAMVLTAFSFGGMFFLGEGDISLILTLSALAGLAAGAGGTVGPSIQADVIDYDEYKTGQRKEGAYFAAWNFVFKASAGVTLILTGFVLEFSGFVPRAVQTEEVKLAIRSLFSVYPFVCYLIGAFLISRFTLNESEYRVIRQELDRRDRERESS